MKKPSKYLILLAAAHLASPSYSEAEDTLAALIRQQCEDEGVDEEAAQDAAEKDHGV